MSYILILTMNSAIKRNSGHFCHLLFSYLSNINVGIVCWNNNNFWRLKHAAISELHLPLPFKSHVQLVQSLLSSESSIYGLFKQPILYSTWSPKVFSERNEKNLQKQLRSYQNRGRQPLLQERIKEYFLGLNKKKVEKSQKEKNYCKINKRAIESIHSSKKIG